MAKVLRKIIQIDEEKCNGCGDCITSCAEGALTMENGKAKLVQDKYCDGLAACLKECPQGALTIVEREAEDFAERATELHLTHWPVQLALVPAGAAFMDQADVVLVADCVPFAYPEFHRDFLRDKAMLVTCPKFDDFKARLAKLTDILSKSRIRSLKVIHMEVPCCSGLTYMAKKAIEASGLNIPFKEVTIGIKGNIKS